PIASIILENDELSISLPNQKKTVRNAKELNLREETSNFRKAFEADLVPDVNVISNGLFGYFSFEAVEFYDDIELTAKENNRRKIPTLQYHIYKYVIAIDHFRNQLHVFENLLDNETSDLDRLQFLIQNKNFPEYTFQVKGEESS